MKKESPLTKLFNPKIFPATLAGLGVITLQQVSGQPSVLYYGEVGACVCTKKKKKKNCFLSVCSVLFEEGYISISQYMCVLFVLIEFVLFFIFYFFATLFDVMM
jgi:hypothetical protein